MTDTQHSTRRSQATASVAAILAESARRFPDDVAVVVGDRRTTYAELWSQTLAYAGALRARGIREGSRVAMLVPNVEDFPRVYYATLALGAVVVPVHALLKRGEIEYVLRDADVSLLVCAAPLLGEGAAGAALAGVDVVTVLAPPAAGADAHAPRPTRPTGSRTSRRPPNRSTPTSPVTRSTPPRSSTRAAPPATRRAPRARTSPCSSRRTRTCSARSTCTAATSCSARSRCSTRSGRPAR